MARHKPESTMLVSMLSLLLLLNLVSSTFAATDTAAAAADTYTISEAAAISKPGCPSKCGNVTIPYPFGIGVDSGCSLNKWFEINCTGGLAEVMLEGLSVYESFDVEARTTFAGPQTSGTPVYEISDSRVRVSNILLTRSCYNGTHMVNVTGNQSSDLAGTPYTYSDLNKFTVVGCDRYRTVTSLNGGIESGCIPTCSMPEGIIGGACSGIGCCESPLLKGQKYYWTSMPTSLPEFEDHSSSACVNMFVGEQGRFDFRGASDLSDPNLMERVRATVPTVLDWWIGNLSCAQVEKSGDYACKGNSHCLDSDTELGGYRCNCDSGYRGNPYLGSGCTDIDECSDHILNSCEKICTNTIGSFTCSCPNGMSGDGRKNGKGCNPQNREFPVIKVALGTGFGLLALVAIVSCMYLFIRKRELLNLRKKFFHRNGGLLLQKMLSSKEGSGESTRIFTATELEKATNKYADDRILGRGGYGTVYKGVLPNKSVVAIKKSKGIDETQIEQFINEVVVLTRIYHRNVVKLLGCCLESEVPILVYEYISNGTLFEHIQRKSNWLSWENRLKIASEAAGALAYLHSSASTPIIHRDVKSANILIDEYYTAKISDFGASRLIPLDQTKVTTMVIGTFGYLDPEYFRTSQLTQKSDVYSFGVVIVELLTGGIPIDMKMSEDQRNLTTNFVNSMNENRLFQILEPRVMREGSFEQLQAIAKLIERCLLLNREERPTMKQVAMELEELRKFTKNSWIHQCDSEETAGFMKENGSADLYNISDSKEN